LPTANEQENKMTSFRTLLAACLIAMVPAVGNATVVFDSWTSNEGNSGNYIVTITLNGAFFDVELTVDPWNAAAVGIFFDLGDATIVDDTIQNQAPAGEISVFATDTSGDTCGPGCNINGLDVMLADPDQEWEWVFSLGDAGFEGIQTFSWQMAANSLGEEDFATVAIRAQQLCSGDDLLPEDSGSCGGSDKSYSHGGTQEISEPGTLALFGLGLGLLGWLGRGKTLS